MKYSICIPTVERIYRYGLLKRLLDTHTLEHAFVVGFHLVHENGIGPNETAARALAVAANDAPDFVIHLEDDVDIVNDFIGSVDRWLTAVAVEDIRIYPLGNAARRAMRAAKAAGQKTWEYPLKEFYGATGFAMRPADALDFAREWARRPAWMMPWNGFDVNLRRWHERRVPGQTFLLTPVPCLVDHLGAISSLSNDPSHFTGRYDGYAGREARW